MTSNPRRRLTVLATVLAAAAVAVGSSASFTASSANPSNTFSSGTLTHSNSKGDQAILSAQNMRPGDTATGKVTITNTGSLDGAFTLSQANASGALLAKLTVTITDETSDQQVYSGPVASMPDQPLAGRFAADGGSRTYRFDVTLAADADNTYQGKNATVDYRWSEVQ